jgi:hypothetical protein
MNGQPKVSFERSNEPSVPADERMFDPLTREQRAQFNAKEFGTTLQAIERVTAQQGQRDLVRSYMLATTEAMTRAHAFKVAATTQQEATNYQEEYDRLKGFYESLMKMNLSIEE